MKTNKLAFVATTALVGSLLAATGAFAQSTGTNEIEAVEVIAARGQPNIDGVISAETATKAKASIDQEFISTQATGQSIVQSLNLTPGLNFTNSDPYGSSGGNLRIRGFDGARISLTFDGIPLNDTGNYAIYTNQQLDGELISRASVNMGTTDVDSPTAAATGGTINYSSLKPSSEFGGRVVGSLGEFNYGRIFGLIETGEIGPLGTAGWLAGSYQKYDKFKGPGDLEKWQINGKVYQPIGDNGDFVSLAFHYNENRNAFYRTTSAADFKNFGRDFDNLSVCTRDTPTAGTIDNDNNSATMFDPSLDNGLAAANNPAFTGSCGNFYGVRINPSNTGNIREQAKFSITDNLTFTLDSAVQYTLANGGGSTTIVENSAIVRGASALAGVDYNGDNDFLDTVRVYSPNTTNTRRYTTLASLIWDINDNNTIRASYTYDYGDHRQTGQYGYLGSNGDPQNVFGGKDGQGRKVLNADGYALRTRDRQSFAILNQLSLEYRGRFLDDALQVNVGVRAPFFKRELNQFCLTQLTAVTFTGSNFVTCTSQPTYAYNVDTNPDLAGVQTSPNIVSLAPAGTGTPYLAAFDKSVKYDKVLPNIGLSYTFPGNHTFYVSYAEGLAAPRTDQLYTAGVDLNGAKVVLSDVRPETTKAWDLGYRFRTPNMILSTALWQNDFSNRIVSSFDPDLGFSVDRNVGDVKLWGWDFQVGWTASEKFSLYGSLSYTHSELQDDLLVGLARTNQPTGCTVGTNCSIEINDQLFLPTKGKALVETPEWMAGLRAQYNATDYLSFGLQTKWVDKRYATDMNDEAVNGYNVTDLDIRYDMPWFNDKGAYVQLNVTNLFDEEYFSTISSGNAAKTIPGVVWATSALATANGGIGTGVGFYGIGSPRTLQVTFSAKF
jgi:iron complex outermembrane receptor protein